MIHHITVNGIPYCHAEGTGMFQIPYPTNCAHASAESAEEGIQNCMKQRLNYLYEVVEGPCHNDPFWQTEEGRAAIELEWELQEMSRQ